MKRFMVRIWLPDCPGALGGVATVIGSLGGSLTGIDILERYGGAAIDELIVEMGDGTEVMDRLATALCGIEGVSVEDIREANQYTVDARLDALQTAAELVEQTDTQELLVVLVERAQHDLASDWVTLLATKQRLPLAVAGHPPSPAWLHAFLAGSRSSAAVAQGRSGPDDIAWADLPKVGAALVLGRAGRPFRKRERLQLGALVRIADHRCHELTHLVPEIT